MALGEGALADLAQAAEGATLSLAVTDASAGTLLLRFFHFRTAQAEQLAPGTRLRVYGDVRAGAQGLEMVHPSYQRIDGEAVPGAVLTAVVDGDTIIEPVFAVMDSDRQRPPDSPLL